MTGGFVEISEEDLALVHALQIAPRVAWNDAARILDTHPATLAARWERLRERGVAWTTGHLIGTPEQMSTVFVDV